MINKKVRLGDLLIEEGLITQEQLEHALKLQKESDSIFWWMVEKGSGIVSNKAIEISIWLSFLLINSLAILGVNRFILEIIYIIDKIFTKRG